MKIRIINTDDYEVFPNEYVEILNKYNYEIQKENGKVKHYIEIATIEELIELYNRLNTDVPDIIRGVIICKTPDKKEICIEIYDEYRE